jgi:hypothetical protein
MRMSKGVGMSKRGGGNQTLLASNILNETCYLESASCLSVRVRREGIKCGVVDLQNIP